MTYTVESNGMSADATLGQIVRLLMDTDRKKFRIGSLAPQLLPPIDLGQVAVYRNIKGRISAYAIWAYVTDEVMAEVLANPNRLLHISEWNEGANLLLIDIVAPFGDVKKLVSYLKNDRLKDFSKGIAVRFTETGNVKRISRFIRNPKR